MATTAPARKTSSVDTPASGVQPAVGSEASGHVVSLDAYLRELLPVELGELVQDVVAQMLTEGRLEGVDIHYHLTEERMRLEVPRRPFEQLVEHMVATAAEAMKALTDRPHVLRVIVEPADAFGEAGPRVRVQDTGASVNVEDAMQGAAEHAQALGARLTVKHRPGGGNLFTFELPAGELASW